MNAIQWFNSSNVILVGGNDADAQAFIDAAGITSSTQQSAVNDLVVGLKADSLWTKMTALYPIVGGTADTHKYNLKDPQDTDGAYRITWSGGITHSSTGADPNGTTGEGDTHLDPSSTTDGHMSFYSRDNTWQSGSVGTDNVDMGGASSPATRYLLSAGLSDTNSPTLGFGDPVNAQTGAADGYFLGVLDGTDSVLYKNGSVLGTASISSISDGTFNIGLFHAEGVGGRHTNRECAFASIGSKLTSTDASNLYTLVQAYNTSLSRNVTWDDADTQAFVDATGITDYTQQSAVNDLVVGLKADSIWTKLDAVYPLVGGSATTHKYNLKDPQDTDGAYRITWTGTITHNSNGITGDASTGYGNTFYTDTANDISIGVYVSNTTWTGILYGATTFPRQTQQYATNGFSLQSGVENYAGGTSSAGLNQISRSGGAGTNIEIRQNGVTTTLVATDAGVSAGVQNILRRNWPPTGYSYSDANIRFAFWGTGLTTTDQENLETLVDAYQTSLSRNV